MNGGENSRLQFDLLNAIYSLCLLIILTFSFHVKESVPSIEPTVSGARVILIAVYLVYFIFDWATSISYRHTPLESFPVVLSKMLSIPFLTIVILSLYSEHNWKFLMIGCYAIIVAAWDVWFLCTAIQTRVLTSSVLGVLLAGARLTMSLFVLLPAIIAATGRPDVFGGSFAWYWSCSCVLVGLKFLRLLYLAPFREAHG